MLSSVRLSSHKGVDSCNWHGWHYSGWRKSTLACGLSPYLPVGLDEKEGQTSFVWTPGLKDTDPDGIEPGRSQSGFAVLRTELPGLARTYLQGSIEEPWGLDGLPETPFWTAKVNEIEELDYLLVPVLAPVIPVPNPYNGAELAR